MAKVYLALQLIFQTKSMYKCLKRYFVKFSIFPKNIIFVCFFTKKVGQIKVIHKITNKALPACYVKVYSTSKFKQKPVFHKDGYTDLRGRFDYASLVDNVGMVNEFAILVLSEEYGAVVTSAGALQQ